MKKRFEEVKKNRPLFNLKQKKDVEELADRILSQINPHLEMPEITDQSDYLLLNEKPDLKFCAILDVEFIVKRNGLKMDIWVDDSSQIPTLNYKVDRSK